jgi:hypothetical protein
MFWVALSKTWAVWRSVLVIVKPKTVIAWHRRGFQRYWRWRSRKPGRTSGDFIFLNARHILQVCRDYVSYYNGARPSQALHAIPNPYPELKNPQTETGRVLAIPVLGGVQHDYRRVA